MEQRKRPGLALTGFLVPFALLLATALAYRGGHLAGLGWRGGEYAYVFVGVAVGSILVGIVVKALAPLSPLRSVASGMIIAGSLGVGVTVAIIVLFMVALSNWSS